LTFAYKNYTEKYRKPEFRFKISFYLMLKYVKEAQAYKFK